MKTIVFAMMFIGLFVDTAVANPKKPAATTSPLSVEQQLASQLTYPAALQETKSNSMVIVQFRLDDQNRVTGLQVHSANQSLNDELTKQLAAVKIKPTEPVGYVQPVYTARLRFVK